MQGTRWKPRTTALAASALAHLVLLLAAVLQRPAMPSALEAAVRPDKLIAVQLLPRARRAVPRSMAPARAPRPRVAARGGADAGRPEPQALAARPAPSPAGAEPRVAAEGAPAAGPPVDLRAALRHGVAGCANAAVTGMTRAERERCSDQLALGVASAPRLAIVLEPRIRAYYDAVAKAKAPDGPLTPLRALGSLGMFEGDPRGVTGHPPGIGCKIPFGPGKAPKLPAHWLKLGPCYIAPPQGPLSVEADITPP